MPMMLLPWAHEAKCGGPAPKLVLLTIADWADQAGHWRINISKLAAYTEQTADAVWFCLYGLENRCLIRAGGFEHKAVYVLLSPDVVP
jgi:hypothetical protein